MYYSTYKISLNLSNEILFYNQILYYNEKRREQTLMKWKMSAPTRCLF